MSVLLKPFGDIEWESEAFRGKLEVRGVPPGVESLTEEELADALMNDVDVMIADIFVKVTEKALKRAKNLKGIVCRSIGVDYLDLDAANKYGILVTNIRDYCVVAVAECTMGMILAMARKMPQAWRAVCEGRWDRRYEFRGMELRGKTIGIIGLGNIGRRVAKLARGFGMNVLAFSPRAGKEIAHEVGATSTTLEDLLRKSDVVSIHTSLRDQTRGLLNEERLSMMKPGSFIVNVSRGALIDEEALIKVLKRRHIAGAALDVLCVEPPAHDNPLLRMENVIVTPHIAWYTDQAKANSESTMIEQIDHVIAGKVPKHVVNLEVLPAWQRKWASGE